MAKKKSKSQGASDVPIIIDESKGLVFKNEKELYEFFLPQIELMEQEFYSLRSEQDFNEKDLKKFEEYLEITLEHPDEVWEDRETFPDLTLHHFISIQEQNDEVFYYVASVYVNDDVPTFIFLHFATRDQSLVENYRRGEMIYDHSVTEASAGAIEGDALSEGDPLAVGLYKAMLKVRNEKDIPQAEFQSYAELREETIEAADEIWRTADLNGNILVSFIREVPEHEQSDLHYIVVTQEEPGASVHALLFSFPTTDKTLVERYRHGENLQADEVVQESSH